MLFIILAPDRPNALEQRLALRQSHIDYWNGLPGAVKIAGAMLEHDGADAAPKGSSFIIEAENMQAARDLLAADPFTLEGVFGPDVRIEVLRPGIGAWKSS